MISKEQAIYQLWQVHKFMDNGSEYPAKDPQLVIDLLEELLKIGKFKEVERIAKDILLVLHPMHIEAARIVMILIRANILKNKINYALELFKKADDIIDFALGPDHPLHGSLYNIFSSYYMSVNKFDEAATLIRSSILNFQRSIGADHVLAAELYIQLAGCLRSTNQREEALEFLGLAHEIYSKNGLKAKKAETGVDLCLLLFGVGKPIESSILIFIQ
jgi:tetratricopeptide (TPR) repeat protein